MRVELGAWSALLFALGNAKYELARPSSVKGQSSEALRNTNNLATPSRAAFEAWAATHYFLCELSTDYDAKGDCYHDNDMDLAWHTWQAATTPTN